MKSQTLYLNRVKPMITDIEFHVEGWENKTLKSRYFTAYDKENSGEDKLHKAALSGTMKLQKYSYGYGCQTRRLCY